MLEIFLNIGVAILLSFILAVTFFYGERPFLKLLDNLSNANKLSKSLSHLNQLDLSLPDLSFKVDIPHTVFKFKKWDFSMVMMDAKSDFVGIWNKRSAPGGFMFSGGHSIDKMMMKPLLVNSNYLIVLHHYSKNEKLRFDQPEVDWNKDTLDHFELIMQINALVLLTQTSTILKDLDLQMGYISYLYSKSYEYEDQDVADALIKLSIALNAIGHYKESETVMNRAKEIIHKMYALDQSKKVRILTFKAQSLQSKRS